MVLHSDEDKNNLLKSLQQIELEYPIDVVIKKATRVEVWPKTGLSGSGSRMRHHKGIRRRGSIEAYCKLHFGVPILRRDSLEYRQKYDRIIRPMSYEQKLELMVEPFDFPVTSAMNVAQHGAVLGFG